MSEYPSAARRNVGYFARYAKALFASNAVEHAGIDGVMLALFVASKEDRLHYRRPPKIWREEIMDRLQLRSPKRVITVRESAINAGLLHYDKASRRAAATIWTTIPDWMEPFFHVPKRNIKTSIRSETEHKVEHKTEHKTERKTERIPKDPIPSTLRPRSKKVFQKPTLEEIQAYCTERRNAVDPEQFLDHYTANGWVQGKGKPIRDWKACVRTWERNGVNTPSKPASNIDKYQDLSKRKPR